MPRWGAETYLPLKDSVLSAGAACLDWAFCYIAVKTAKNEKLIVVALEMVLVLWWYSLKLLPRKRIVINIIGYPIY